MNNKLYCIKVLTVDGEACFIRNSGFLRLVSEEYAKKEPDEIYVTNNIDDLDKIKTSIIESKSLQVSRLVVTESRESEIDVNSIKVVAVSEVDYLKKYWFDYIQDEVNKSIKTAESIGVSAEELVGTNAMKSLGKDKTDVSVDKAQKCLNFFVDNLAVDLTYANTKEECKTQEALNVYVDIYNYAVKKLEEVNYPFSYKV